MTPSRPFSAEDAVASRGWVSQPAVPPLPAAFDAPELYDGVRSRRVTAFGIDLVVLTVLMGIAYVVLFLLGIPTLSLTWWLMPLVWPGVPIVYEMFSLGGRDGATPGMKMAGIEMRAADGGRMYPLLALVHSLLFWASVTFLTPLVLLVGLVTPKKRLLHDIVLGTLVARSDTVRRRAL